MTQLVLIAADNAADAVGAVKVVGTAVVNGQKITQQARYATITWGVQPQQNIADDHPARPANRCLPCATSRRAN